MIQLTKHGVAGTADLEALEHQFERSHVFRLHRLLHPDLMEAISTRLERCTWITEADGQIAKEGRPSDLTPAGLLDFAVNAADFLELIRRITRCSEITWFGGRVYRMVPLAGHFDSWHSDIGSTHDDRMVGMSINLGQPYEGGVFRLRDEASGQVLCELPNTGPGDAIFFRISPALKHMVTPLEGSEPKTAFAGWFRTGKVDFYSRLRGTANAGPAD